MVFSNMADVIYDDILNQVRNSGLNFQIKVSPFSAAIYLKKSIVKDRSGNFLLPKPPNISAIKNYDNLVSKNEELERELLILHKSCNEVSTSLAAVESQLEALKNKEAMEDQVRKNTSSPDKNIPHESSCDSKLNSAIVSTTMDIVSSGEATNAVEEIEDEGENHFIDTVAKSRTAAERHLETLKNKDDISPSKLSPHTSTPLSTICRNNYLEGKPNDSGFESRLHSPTTASNTVQKEYSFDVEKEKENDEVSSGEDNDNKDDENYYIQRIRKEVLGKVNCKKCGEGIEDERCIDCTICGSWFHYSCNEEAPEVFRHFEVIRNRHRNIWECRVCSPITKKMYPDESDTEDEGDTDNEDDNEDDNENDTDKYSSNLEKEEKDEVSYEDRHEENSPQCSEDVIT